MKCSPSPQAVIDMMYEPTDQPEVAELEGDDGWRQWNLAQKLSEAQWEPTVPMDLPL